MRRIENWGDGELLEEILVFETEEERSEYFARGDRAINDSQKQSLANLHSAYMSNVSKARKNRSGAGRQRAKGAFIEINSGYMEQVRKVHEAYARVRAELRTKKEKSLLETQISQETESA